MIKEKPAFKWFLCIQFLKIVTDAKKLNVMLNEVLFSSEPARTRTLQFQYPNWLVIRSAQPSSIGLRVPKRPKT